MNTNRILLVILIVIVLSFAGVWTYQNYLAPQPPTPTPMPSTDRADISPSLVSAEGKVVPAAETTLGFTQAGRVVDVLVQEGAKVFSGDPLVRLDSAALQAAVDQAQAALEVAQANLNAALTQAQQVSLAAHLSDADTRTADWSTRSPSDISQPAWYFDQDQQIASLQAEVEAARAALDIEQANLQSILEDISSADFLAAEARLADAQAAFMVARDLLDTARSSADRDLQDQAQSLYDIALSKLDAAQANYNQILDDEEIADVVEAKARVTVAQERYDRAVDRLNALQTGDYSLEMQAAQDFVLKAEAAVAQAQAALQASQIALEEATLLAPMDGVVVQVKAEVGKILSPGLPVIVLGDLSAWRVETTDLAENDVVLLEAGMPATVTLDAFPGKSFEATVQEIALKGEDSRGTVVYAVFLEFDPGNAPVRWGMTAFVDVPLP